MIKKEGFYIHSAVLTALFIMGNAVIILPVKKADEYTFLGFLLTALISVFAVLVLSPVTDFIFGKEITADNSKIWKIAVLVCCGVTAVLSLFCLGGAFLNLGKFISDVLLPDFSDTIIFIILLGVSFFFALKRQEDILKFSVLGFGFCLLFVLFFFFAGFENYNPRNIYIFSLPDFKTMIFQAKPYFKNVFLAVLLLPVYHSFVFKKVKKSALFWGAVTGCILLGLCILGALLLFGTELSGKLDYPFASAVSTITVGRIFTRMDGFSYIIYFVTSIIKITVSIFIIRKSLEKINSCLS